MQTRLFETANEKELLSASAAALQDLGFQVEESVRAVGFLRATKERSAREYGQYIQPVFFWSCRSANCSCRWICTKRLRRAIVTRAVNQDGPARKSVSCFTG